MTTANENAVEYGRHERFGGWQQGLLVACSVQPAANGVESLDGDKVSASAFARASGVNVQTILNYFHAWERAAAARIVPRAARLTPDDAHEWDLPVGYDWADYMDHRSGSTNTAGAAVRAIDTHGPDAVVAAMPGPTRRALVDALVEQDPHLAERAQDVAAGRRRGHSSAGTGMADRAAAGVARAVGTDAATTDLRRAASALAHAEIARVTYGIEHPDDEADALADVDRARKLYGRNRGKWSDTDRDFLQELGVTL